MKIRAVSVVLLNDAIGKVLEMRRGRARERIGILWSEELLQSVMKWKEESSELMVIRLRIGKKCWAFIRSYDFDGENSEKVANAV